jgi:hypothetical protein
VEKILKDKMFIFGLDTTRPIRDGELLTLINIERNPVKDSTENMDSTSTEHSTSDQECQCKELPKELEVMLDLEDIKTTTSLNNSTST